MVQSATNDGGLLDFLRNLSGGGNPMNGLPSDQAQYDQPPAAMQNFAPAPAGWPFNNPAASSAMARMPDAQAAEARPVQQALVAPSPPQGASPGLGDRLMAGLLGFSNSNALLPALVSGIGGLATGQRMDTAGIEQRNALQSQTMNVKALQEKGVGENLLAAAIGNPDLLKKLNDTHFGKPDVSSIGSGWILRDGKPERVYTPDKPDKEEPTSVREYVFYKQNLPPGATAMPFDVWTTAKARAGAMNINNAPDFGGGSDKQIFDSFAENTKEARAAATGLTALRTARQSLEGPGGAITGFGADERLTLQKLGAQLGLRDPSAIQNTETFRAAIAPQIAATLKSTVGTANISNSDRDFAEKAAGGSIKLDAGSISRLLNIMEQSGKARLDLHQEQLEAVYPDAVKHKRERALFGVRQPAAPQGARIDDLISKYGPR